jgi:hypothetical protein
LRLKESSDRKARLLEVACFRRLLHWPWLKDHRWAVEVMERHADGHATLEEAQRAEQALRQVREAAICVMGGMYGQAFADWEDHHTDAFSSARMSAEAMEIAAGRMVRAASGLNEHERPDWKQRQPEVSVQCQLTRCIFGCPFRSLPAIERTWLAGNSGTVMKLAQAIYDERAFDRMPILADALEDAGCTNQDILSHCRGEGPHVRGCWVVDLFLERA